MSSLYFLFYVVADCRLAITVNVVKVFTHTQLHSQSNIPPPSSLQLTHTVPYSNYLRLFLRMLAFEFFCTHSRKLNEPTSRKRDGGGLFTSIVFSQVTETYLLTNSLAVVRIHDILGTDPEPDPDPAIFVSEL